MAEVDRQSLLHLHRLLEAKAEVRLGDHKDHVVVVVLKKRRPHAEAALPVRHTWNHKSCVDCKNHDVGDYCRCAAWKIRLPAAVGFRLNSVDAVVVHSLGVVVVVVVDDDDTGVDQEAPDTILHRREPSAIEGFDDADARGRICGKIILTMR